MLGRLGCTAARLREGRLVTIAAVTDEGLGNSSYLVELGDGRALVVDPSRDVAPYLREADLVLHAGDVCTADVLDELSGYAPVRVVLGNNAGPAGAEGGWGPPGGCGGGPRPRGPGPSAASPPAG